MHESIYERAAVKGCITCNWARWQRAQLSWQRGAQLKTQAAGLCAIAQSAAGRKAAKYSGEELAEAVGVIVPVDYASWALAVAVASVVTYRLLSAGV